MKIKISRNKVLILSLAIILLFYLINRLDKIRRSEFTCGKIIQVEIKYYKNTKEVIETIPHIEYIVGNKKYEITGNNSKNVNLGDEIKVIYNPQNPAKAGIYNFMEFWLSALLYCLIPIMLIFALVLSFIESGGYIVINFKNKK